ncbi:hypothetical protein F5B17DRAFT_183077 [Nemania serpens]|nr:hypothetical protein F5B17DRAFT_183077 [Nemania serpens]
MRSEPQRVGIRVVLCIGCGSRLAWSGCGAGWIAYRMFMIQNIYLSYLDLQTKARHIYPALGLTAIYTFILSISGYNPGSNCKHKHLISEMLTPSSGRSFRCIAQCSSAQQTWNLLNWVRNRG